MVLRERGDDLRADQQVGDIVLVVICASQLEVPVVGRQPRVEQVRDGDAPASKNQRPWRLLAAVACIALDTNTQRCHHFFHIRGSKLNDSDRPIKSCRNARWIGFRAKLRSCGMTTEGTERTAVLDARNHCSPIIASGGEGGTFANRQAAFSHRQTR